MKTGNYLCKLCDNEFEPTRRGFKSFVVVHVEKNTLTIKTKQQHKM